MDNLSDNGTDEKKNEKACNKEGGSQGGTARFALLLCDVLFIFLISYSILAYEKD